MGRKSNLILLFYIQFFNFTVYAINSEDSHVCTRNRAERRTRFEPYRRLQTFTRYNWLGFIVNDQKYVTDHRLEYYWGEKTEYYCCPGYENSHNKCVPRCGMGCPAHSTCIAPEHCECNMGYHGDIMAFCVPRCSKPCPPNSECVAPDLCQCRRGYRDQRQQPDTLTDLECTPVCNERCPLHSSCQRPNECVCEAGYRMQRLFQHRAYCEAQCEQDCSPYGKCVAPNVCQCFEGYAMRRNVSDHALQTTTTGSDGHTDITNVEDNSIDGTTSVWRTPSAPTGEHCQPICSSGCTNGLCIAPNVCVCNVGYLMGANQTCEPVCTLGCQSGRCVEPEICECEPGHQLAPNSVSVCVPSCTPSCVNGSCIAPDFCVCWEHYKPKQTHQQQLGSFTLEFHHVNECEPICSVECGFGECVAPETCRCLEGYAADPESDGNHCKPQCNHCTNGDCVAPEQCNCWDGYEVGLTQGDCVAITTITPTTTVATTTTTATTTTIATTTTGETTTFATLETTAKTTLQTAHSTTDFPPMSSISTEASTNFDAAASTITTPCTAQCKCWQHSQTRTAHSETKCVYICADEYDEPCLQLSKCQCDEAQLRMRCLESSGANSDTFNATDDSVKGYTQYSCVVNLTKSSVAHNDSSTVDYLPTKTTKVASVPWLLIIACTAGCLLLMGAGIFVWRMQQLRSESGEYDVSLRNILTDD